MMRRASRLTPALPRKRRNRSRSMPRKSARRRTTSKIRHRRTQWNTADSPPGLGSIVAADAGRCASPPGLKSKSLNRSSPPVGVRLLVLLQEFPAGEMSAGIRLDLVVLQATDGAIHLQHGERDIVIAGDPVLAQGAL